jgi:hypothetical protein
LPRQEKGRDGDEVFGQFLLWVELVESGRRVWVTLADDHEPHIVATKYVLQQLRVKARKPVPKVPKKTTGGRLQ